MSSNLLNQYHPFRESIPRGESQGESSSGGFAPKPAQERLESRNDLEDAAGFMRFYNRLRKIIKGLVIFGVGIGAIYLYFALRGVLHGDPAEEVMEKPAQKPQSKSSSSSFALEDDGEWEYQGGNSQPAPRPRSGLKAMFCKGNTRPAFCD